MAKLMRLVKIGGCLTLTIPRDLVRELGLVARESVWIERAEGDRLTIWTAKGWTRERERIRGNPRRAD